MKESFKGSSIGDFLMEKPVIINLDHDCYYSSETKTLYIRHSFGFLSNCLIALWAIMDLYYQQILPEKIDFSKTFKLYKTQEQLEKEEDVYPYYFKMDNTKSLELNKVPLHNKIIKAILPYFAKPDVHAIYKMYRFGFYNLFIQRYFNLTDEILDIENRLIEKYKIDFKKTIAVYYRGTDKYTEVRLASPNLYLTKAEEILQANPDMKILIQTDQEQVRDLFINHFKDRCFYFEELPVTNGTIGIHDLDDKALGINRFEYGKIMLAVTHLLSKCNFIIAGTSTVTAWVCFFRRNAKNLLEMDKEGRLVNNMSIIKDVIKRGKAKMVKLFLQMTNKLWKK